MIQSDQRKEQRQKSQDGDQLPRLPVFQIGGRHHAPRQQQRHHADDAGYDSLF